MHHLLIVSVNGDPLADLGSLHAGGQCKYILELGKHLVRDNWMIDVYTTLNPGTPVHDEVTHGFEVFRFPLADGRPYESQLTTQDFQALQSAMVHQAVTRVPAYDAILACYWQSAIVGVALRSAIGRKLVLTFCSLAYYKLQAVTTTDVEHRMMTEKSLAADADHVIATSRSERDVLTAIYGVTPQKISVIPRGVDLDVFRTDD